MSLEKCNLFNSAVNSTTTDIKIISSNSCKYLIDYKGNKVTDTGIISNLNYTVLDIISFKDTIENLDIDNKSLVSCIINLYKIIAKDIKDSLPICDNNKFKFIIDNLFNFIIDFDLNSFNKDDIERYFKELYSYLVGKTNRSYHDGKCKDFVNNLSIILYSCFYEVRELVNKNNNNDDNKSLEVLK